MYSKLLRHVAVTNSDEAEPVALMMALTDLRRS
jgi:hypothetical protein